MDLAEKKNLLEGVDARTRLAGSNKMEILLFSLGTDTRTGRRETYGINVFKVREALPDYSALYGASTCSSTAGGAPLSPLRNVNAFELLAPVQAASYVTSEGLTSLMSAAQSDPVLRPMSIADATYCMERFNA